MIMTLQKIRKPTRVSIDADDIAQKIEHLGYYKEFFDRNHLALVMKIHEYKENSHLWNEDDPVDGAKFDEFKIEFARHLHNYLMSLYSLKEKTLATVNNLNKKYGDRVVKDKDYDDKIEFFKVNEYFGFLNRLRNAFTHGSTNEGLELIEFHDGYICIGVGNGGIEPILKSYAESVDKFYQWIVEELGHAIGKDVDANL